MLTNKTRNFIEKTVFNLIIDYEKATGKKYNPNDLESILDIVNFFNGNVIYLNDLYSKYETDEILLSKKDGFTIIIDKEYRETQIEDTELSIKKIIFRMIWMYIEEYISDKNNINTNKILYPTQCNIKIEDLNNMIKTQNNQIKEFKKINKDD